MSITIEQSFVKQFEADVHLAYQQIGTKLRSTIRSKSNVEGSSTTFQKVGKGTAATKSRHGLVPVMNLNHEPIECILSDYYAGYLGLLRNKNNHKYSPTKEQAEQIYKMDFWDNTKIVEIKNIRIRNAAFDINVLSGPDSAKQIQESLNNIGYNVNTDGIMGSQTINALNNIHDGKINHFMDSLKETRLEYLKTTKNWDKSNSGWIDRTYKY